MCPVHEPPSKIVHGSELNIDLMKSTKVALTKRREKQNLKELVVWGKLHIPKKLNYRALS